MPDATERRRKTPPTAVMTVAEFYQRFGTRQACLAKLRDVRWGADLERDVAVVPEPSQWPTGPSHPARRRRRADRVSPPPKH